VCFRQAGFQLIPDKEGFKTLFAEKFVEPESKQVTDEQSLTLQGSLEQDSIVTESDADEIVDEVKADADTDPMELPYIYVKNVNAKFYEESFEDHTTHFKVDLKAGFKDGSFKEYYPNGKVKMTGEFKRDKRDGTWRLYDETGKLLMKRNYDEGKVTKEKVKD
jgi:antitoxin component YwqK of YwqJK toxin-antitoxin module